MQIKQKRKNLMTQYLEEEVFSGGEWISRGKLILELQKIGGTQRQISIYMMGLDRNKEAPCK